MGDISWKLGTERWEQLQPGYYGTDRLTERVDAPAQRKTDMPLEGRPKTEDQRPRTI